MTHPPAVSLSSAETTEEPGCSQVKMTYFDQFWLFHQTTTGFSVVSADDDKTARVNDGRRVSSKSPSLARAGEEEGARKRTRLDSSIPI